MFKKIDFQEEFYQKLRVLVLPITIQNFMLALVSATDAVMLGAVDQTSLSAVSRQWDLPIRCFLCLLCWYLEWSAVQGYWRLSIGERRTQAPLNR